MDDGDVFEFDVGVVDQRGDGDGLVLLKIVVLLIKGRKGRVRRWLALVEVVCERPEIRHGGLQMSHLVGADRLDP